MKVSLTGGKLRVEKTFGPRGINHGPCGLICFHIQCVSLKLPLVGKIFGANKSCFCSVFPRNQVLVKYCYAFMVGIGIYSFSLFVCPAMLANHC